MGKTTFVRIFSLQVGKKRKRFRWMTRMSGSFHGWIVDLAGRRSLHFGQNQQSSSLSISSFVNASKQVSSVTSFSGSGVGSEACTGTGSLYSLSEAPAAQSTTSTIRRSSRTSQILDFGQALKSVEFFNVAGFDKAAVRTRIGSAARLRDFDDWSLPSFSEEFGLFSSLAEVQKGRQRSVTNRSTARQERSDPTRKTKGSPNSSNTFGLDASYGSGDPDLARARPAGAAGVRDSSWSCLLAGGAARLSTTSRRCTTWISSKRGGLFDLERGGASLALSASMLNHSSHLALKRSKCTRTAPSSTATTAPPNHSPRWSSASTRDPIPSWRKLVGNAGDSSAARSDASE
mmetsp:Transcript_20303/g.68828  ORF Transcript_20303/g.68828 Transcript_20303/m.68828 type:complete len:346 (+) Transcript_20303:534-1571(+)